MPSYATIQEFARLGIAEDALAGTPDEVKEDALDAASSLADGYLQAQFVLPLSAWGDDLRRMVVAIAVYDLMTHRGYDPEALGNATIRDRYDDAIRWLEKVAAGTIAPAGIIDATPEVDDAAPVIYSDPPRGW